MGHPAPVHGGGRPGGPNLIVGYTHGDAVVAVGDDRAAVPHQDGACFGVLGTLRAQLG